MAVKIPKSVTIGGRVIAVRVDPELDDWGQYRADTAEIVLSTKTVAKSADLRLTLRHEMLHAALDIGGISYMKHYDEEPIVRCIDHIFHPAWEQTRKQLTP